MQQNLCEAAPHSRYANKKPAYKVRNHYAIKIIHKTL